MIVLYAIGLIAALFFLVLLLPGALGRIVAAVFEAGLRLGNILMTVAVLGFLCLWVLGIIRH